MTDICKRCCGRGYLLVNHLPGYTHCGTDTGESCPDYYYSIEPCVCKEIEGLPARVKELEASYLRCFNDLNVCAGKLIDAEAQLAAESQSCKELIAGRLIALARIDHLELRVCEVVDERDALVIRLATSEAARVKFEKSEEYHVNCAVCYMTLLEEGLFALDPSRNPDQPFIEPPMALGAWVPFCTSIREQRDTAIRARDEALSTLSKWDLENNQLKQQLSRIRTALSAERAIEIAGDCSNDRIISDFDIEALRSYADILEDVEKLESLTDALQAANERAEVAEEHEEQLQEETGIYLKIFTELGKLVNAPKGEPEPYVSVVEWAIRRRISELGRQNGLLREALEPIRKYLLSRAINLEPDSPALRDDCIISECADGVSLTLGMLRASIEDLAPVEPQGEETSTDRIVAAIPDGVKGSPTNTRQGEPSIEAGGINYPIFLSDVDYRFLVEVCSREGRVIPALSSLLKDPNAPTGTADDQIPRETVAAIREELHCLDCLRLQGTCKAHTPANPPVCPNCAGLKKALEETAAAIERLMPIASWCPHENFSDFCGSEDSKIEALSFARTVLASAKALLSGGGQEGK